MFLHGPERCVGLAPYLVDVRSKADLDRICRPFMSVASDPTKALRLPGDNRNCLLFGLADGKYRKQILVSKRPGKGICGGNLCPVKKRAVLFAVSRSSSD
jgi:hypothetical protein